MAVRLSPNPLRRIPGWDVRSKALELDPNLARTFVEYGNTWAARRAYDTAIEFYTEARLLDPALGIATYNRAAAYDNKGDYSAAYQDYSVAAFQASLKQTKDSPDNAIYQRAVVALRLGLYNVAIDDFTKYIPTTPFPFLSYLGRAMAWYQVGDYDKAIADLSQIGTTSAEVIYSRGSVFARRGEFAKALADFTQAARMNPKLREAWMAIARLRAACPDATFRDAKAAVEAANKAGELGGWTDPIDLENLAAALAANGQFDEARRRLGEAVARDGKASEETRNRRDAMARTFAESWPFRDQFLAPPPLPVAIVFRPFHVEAPANAETASSSVGTFTVWPLMPIPASSGPR